MPVVVSMSAVATFRKCKKSFELSDLMKLNPVGTRNESVDIGSLLHEMLALAAEGGEWQEWPTTGVEHLVDVVSEYLSHNPLPDERRILGIEHSYYTLVLEENEAYPGSQPLYVRTTLDLVYKTIAGTVRGRDYKTFTKAPTLDLDLDFQGRLYATILQRHYPDAYVDFEWEYIRQEVGRDLKGGYTLWPIEDRYLNVPMVMSEHEMETTWQELRATCKDILRKMRERMHGDKFAFYREDSKGAINSCSSCFYRKLCQVEYANGELDTQDLAMLTQPWEYRESVQAIEDDPRVQFLQRHGVDRSAAITAVYPPPTPLEVIKCLTTVENSTNSLFSTTRNLPRNNVNLVRRRSRKS